jgi:hypothetical protein
VPWIWWLPAKGRTGLATAFQVASGYPKTLIFALRTKSPIELFPGGCGRLAFAVTTCLSTNLSFGLKDAFGAAHTPRAQGLGNRNIQVTGKIVF